VGQSISLLAGPQLDVITIVPLLIAAQQRLMAEAPWGRAARG
jgi:hypothetical protein